MVIKFHLPVEGQVSLDILIFSNMTSEEMNQIWKEKTSITSDLKLEALLYLQTAMTEDLTDCANQPDPLILWNFTSVTAQPTEVPTNTLWPFVF